MVAAAMTNHPPRIQSKNPSYWPGSACTHIPVARSNP
jgi:hypothetical protein